MSANSKPPNSDQAEPRTSSNEPWRKFIVVAGLAGCGKTFTILKFLAAANLVFPHQAVGAAKPFDTGLMTKNAREQTSDGEIFSAILAQQPNSTFLTPYLTYSSYPFEFSLAEEGNRLNYAFLEARLLKLTKFFKPIFLESPGGLATPLSPQTSFLDWSAAKLRAALLVFDLDPKSFSSTLLEAEKLKLAFPHAAVVLNARGDNPPPTWLDYVQNKLEQEMGLAVLGFIPHQSLTTEFNEAPPAWLQAFSDFIKHAENL